MWVVKLVTATAVTMTMPALARCQSTSGPGVQCNIGGLWSGERRIDDEYHVADARSVRHEPRRKRVLKDIGTWLPGNGLVRALCPWEGSYITYHTVTLGNSKGTGYRRPAAYYTDYSATENDENKRRYSTVAFTSRKSPQRKGSIPTLASDDVEGLTPWQPKEATLLPSRQRGRRGRARGGKPLNGLFGGALSTWTGKFVALNVAGFAIQMFYPGFTRWGAKVSDYIFRDHEWHRLLSPVFLHADLSHLAVNSMSLINVGPNVEGLFGKSRYIATYLAAGIAGNVASALFSPSRPSVGASGAIFGLIGAYYTFLYVNQPFFGESGKRGRRAMQQTLVVNILYGLSTPNIDNWGHIGGALGGAAMAYVFGPRLFLYDDYYNNRRIIVDKPIIRVPKSISGAPSTFKGKLRRQRRKAQADRYTSSPSSRYKQYR